MRRQHFIISTGINVDANYDNFKKLITFISDKGFMFYEAVSLFEKISDPKSFFLSNEYIINKLINLNGENYYSFKSKYQDTVISFLISVPSNNKGFTMSWDIKPSAWDRKFSVLYSSIDEDDMPKMSDNARYARLQLELVKNFPLEYFFIVEEDFHVPFKEIPSDSIKAKFTTELEQNILVQELTYNILYNKCIMLDSIENKKEYSIDDFKKIFYHSIKYGVHFNFIAKQEDQLLNVIINNKNEITITPINYIKKFSFEDKEFVDIPFYVRLILGFCEDLVILQLETNFEQA